MDDYSAKDFYIVELNGRKLSREKSFINILKEEFRFPQYFGGSLDAVNDCMRDLSWIDQKNYVIRIRNSFDKKGFDYKKTFSFIKEYWDEKYKKSEGKEGLFIVEYK